MSRPLIGLTTYVATAAWTYFETEAALLHMAYVDSVRDAGGRPVLLPPDDVDDGVLDQLDALVLTGGSDVGAEHYGAVPHEQTRSNPVRDAGELLLTRGAFARDLPILGVCRGLQLMAVATGGTLHQHLPDVVGSTRHCVSPLIQQEFCWHDVKFEPGSLTAEVLGHDLLSVPSLHHQAIDDPGTLTPVGWCPDDGVIEAAEDRSRRFALGVQWHPEATDDRRLFEALVSAVRDRRATHLV